MPCDAVTMQTARIRADARLVLSSRQAAETFANLVKMKLGLSDTEVTVHYQPTSADIYLDELNIEVHPGSVEAYSGEDIPTGLEVAMAEAIGLLAQFRAMQIIQANAKAITRNEAMANGARLLEIEI